MDKIDYSPLPSYDEVEEMSHSNGNNATIRTRVSPGVEGGSARQPSDKNGRSLIVAEQREEEQQPRPKSPSVRTLTAISAWIFFCGTLDHLMKLFEVRSVYNDLLLGFAILGVVIFAWRMEADLCKAIVKLTLDLIKGCLKTEPVNE